jgi:signal transduction histidine kinase
VGSECAPPRDEEFASEATPMTHWHSLQAQFLRFHVPVVIVATVVLFGIIELQSTRYEREQLQSTLQNRIALERSVVAEPLWNLDVSGVTLILKAIVNEPNVMGAAVYDNAGRVFASVGDLNAAADLLGEAPVEFRTDVSVEPIGILRLALTTKPMDMAQRTRRWLAAAVALILASIVSFASIVAVRRSVRTPLKRMLSAIVETQARGTRQKVEWQSNDELGQVIAAFNAMQQRVESYERSLLDAQSQLHRQRDELEEQILDRTRALVDAQAGLVKQERMAVLGQLTATISHELRNPLATLRNSVTYVSELAARSEVPDAVVMARIVRNIDRADRIVTDLLDYTRIRPAPREEIHLDDWVQALLEEYVSPDSVSVTLSLQCPSRVLRVDEERVRRALINVLDNACQACVRAVESGVESDKLATIMKSDGLVTVSTLIVSGRVEIRVEDSGMGVDADVAAQMFEPLFSTRAFGVGLGLPHARECMKMQSGGLDWSQREGHTGSRFCLWIPIDGEWLEFEH